MEAANRIILRSVRILVACNLVGTSTFSVGYQDLLKNKTVHHIFNSGQPVGKNNEPLTTSPFFLCLVDNNTTILEIPSSELVFNTFKLIDISNENVDWQSSNIVFPTGIVAPTNVELIVYYADKNPPRA